MNLRYLAPMLAPPDIEALGLALLNVTSAVAAELHDRRYSFARFVERLHVNEWSDVFVSAADVAHDIVVITTAWWLPLTKIRQIGIRRGDNALGILSPLARAAAVAHGDKIERVMLCGDPARGVRGLGSYWGGLWTMYTQEVICREAERQRESGELGWAATARAVFGIELEQLPPTWVRFGETAGGEPGLEFILLSRVAGVVKDAVWSPQ